MLKFEGQFKVGQKIKAFDFQPMSDRPSSYIIGTVIEEKNTEHRFNAYKIVILKRVFAGVEEHDEVGDFGWVPHGVSKYNEYDERVQAV
jgi:hypothetical protein